MINEHNRVVTRYIYISLYIIIASQVSTRRIEKNRTFSLVAYRSSFVRWSCRLARVSLDLARELAHREPDGGLPRSSSNFLIFQRRDSFAHRAITEPTVWSWAPTNAYVYVRTRVPTRVETTAYRRPGFQEDGERGARERQDETRWGEARRGASFRDGHRRRRRRKRGPTTIRLEKRAFPLPANSPRWSRFPRISLVFASSCPREQTRAVHPPETGFINS